MIYHMNTSHYRKIVVNKNTLNVIAYIGWVIAGTMFLLFLLLWFRIAKI